MEDGRYRGERRGPEVRKTLDLEGDYKKVLDGKKIGRVTRALTKGEDRQEAVE